MTSGVFPFSNAALWRQAEQTYRRSDKPVDDMISVVHDGSHILINTSGRHTESKSFYKCSKYGLYLPQDIYRSAKDDPPLIERMLADPDVRKSIGIDRVKDPQALHDVLVESLGSFRSYSDLQLSARIGSDYWDGMVPLRDFVLANNFTESGCVKRTAELSRVQKRELPETVLQEAREQTHHRSSDYVRDVCLLQ